MTTFIARNRAPRVAITYPVELYGAQKAVQLPFVVGVMSNLSGSPAEPLPPVYDRSFLEISVDNFDDRLRGSKPRVAFRLDQGSGKGALDIQLQFETFDDFSPGAIARKVPELNHLLETRTILANLITYLDGKPDAEDLVARLLNDASLREAFARVKPEGEEAPAATRDLEAELVTAFRANTERSREEVIYAVRTLARSAPASPGIAARAIAGTIGEVIGELDHELTEPINRILHHKDFQDLESAWRGLRYLVENTETDSMLKIRVLNVTKSELGKTLRRFKGTAWDQSPLFKKIYEQEYGQLGGEPYGCFVGDYEFDYSPQDVELLGEMARIAAAAYAPFLAAASPRLFQMESWQEIANPRDLAGIFSTPDYGGWRALRDTDDARYLGLTLPRFLARRPYGARSEPVEDFAFEENTSGSESNPFAWTNSAYAMAANIARAFKLYGWCSRIRGIESGGAVTGLPTHVFPTDDGGVDMTCPTEIAISDRREAALAKLGFMPLVHRKNSDFAAFIGAQTLYKPPPFDDPDATANASLSGRLPYVFAVCRFVHYLKCVSRDKIGSFKSASDMQLWLQRWIAEYVDGDPRHSSEESKARRPLAEAQVFVELDEELSGAANMTLWARPHYQLEGLTIALQAVTKVPAPRGG